jgi:hypothetical protein
MKDYSNYHPSYRNKILNDGYIEFGLRKDSLEGYDVTVDGTDTKLIITDKYNNPNGDLKKITGDIGIFNIGSVVVYQNKNWIVIQSTQDNPIYQSGIIQKSNNTLKFYSTSTLSTDENPILYEVPCIVSNKITLGINETTHISLPDKTVMVTVPNNSETLQIYEGQRFVLGRNTYKCDGIDEITISGLLNLRMSQTQKDENDDVENGVAVKTTIEEKSSKGGW